MTERERKPAPRLTEKEQRYRDLLEEHGASGKTLVEFAAEKGLSLSTLSWWKGEIRRREAIRHGRPVPRRRRYRRRPPQLVPVTVAGAEAPSLPAGHFEVSLPGGAAVRVPFHFDAESFKRLVSVLREAC
jgi:hypothetical protein